MEPLQRGGRAPDGARPAADIASADVAPPTDVDEPAAGLCAHPARRDAGQAADRRPCVLVVDDEPELTTSVRYLLEDEYRVLTASSADEALGLLAQHSVAVLLTDHRMPGGTGAELLARSLYLFPETTRILFSAYTDVRCVIEAVNDGQVFHYLSKPWAPEELRDVLARGAERHRLLCENRRLTAHLEDLVRERTAQLETANAELEAFAYSVSHDLRTPLRAIDGFTQMVIEDAGRSLSSADVEHLQRARRAAQRMGSYIDGLLAVSRASRHELVRTRFDLGALASGVVEELLEAQPGRLVDVRAAPGLWVDADQLLTRIVLINLLANALKFTSTHDAACIEVGVSEDEGERAYFVRDDGIGFDAARAERLFGAFQRLHGHEEFEGDGIGLATVRRIVARHGGRVWAQGEVEQGATFFFTLPAPARS